VVSVGHLSNLNIGEKTLLMCMCIHKLDIIYVAYVYFAHDFFFEKPFWHGWMWNEAIND
jgi:hypothetical protein